MSGFGDLPPEALRGHLHRVADWIADYRAGLPNRRITPDIKSGAVRVRLRQSGHRARHRRERGAEGGERRALQSTGFRILRAVEMNLSPGDLDLHFLTTLDRVLCAFHSRLRLEDDQTERYLAALRHPSLTVSYFPRNGWRTVEGGRGPSSLHKRRTVLK